MSEERFELMKRFPGDFGRGDYCRYCGTSHKGVCEEERRFKDEEENEEAQFQELLHHQKERIEKELAPLKEYSKEIHWDNHIVGKTCFASVQVSAFCGIALTNFNKLSGVLKESFPQIGEDEIGCTSLLLSEDSDSPNWLIAVFWKGQLPVAGEYKGWVQCN